MKKIVKQKDINSIIKKYNLSECEIDELEIVCREINNEKDEYIFDTSLSFYLSPNYPFANKDKYNAVAALLHYFGVKAQKETGMFFDETCTYLSLQLNAVSCWIKRMFRGMSYNDKRWTPKMYLADKCGLNTLELYN